MEGSTVVGPNLTPKNFKISNFSRISRCGIGRSYIESQKRGSKKLQCLNQIKTIEHILKMIRGTSNAIDYNLTDCTIVSMGNGFRKFEKEIQKFENLQRPHRSFKDSSIFHVRLGRERRGNFEDHYNLFCEKHTCLLLS